MADPRQAALPVAVLDDAQNDEILPTATSTRTRSTHGPVQDDTLEGEDDDEKPPGSTIRYIAQDGAAAAALPPEQEAEEEDYRRDGGRKAWSTVAAGFLFSERQQLAIVAAGSTAAERFIPNLPPTKVFICLGQPNSFGIFQAHYKFVTFPEASELVRRTPLPQPLSLNS